MRVASFPFRLLLPVAAVVLLFPSLALARGPRASASTFQAEVSSVSTGSCINDAGGANTDATLSQALCAASAPQGFIFAAQSDGTYIIHSPTSINLCVDLDDSGAVVQNFCLPTASQKWLTGPNADGSTALVNQQNNQCIVAGANGFSTAVCSAAVTAQKFTFVGQQAYTMPAPATNLRPPTIPVAAAATGQWQAGMYQGMPYRILFPAGYDPSHTIYSLALFLHGDGERGTDNLAQLNDDLSALTTDMDFRANAPLIIVAPQCPVSDTWGNALATTPSPSEALAVQLVQALTAALPVDPKRVTVTGLSMGGIGTWDVINRYPAVFAGAAPVAGAGSAVLEAKNLVNVPILAVHSVGDPIIPAFYDEAMYAAIRSLGGNRMYYFEVPGSDHGVWNLVYTQTVFWQLMGEQVHN